MPWEDEQNAKSWEAFEARLRLSHPVEISATAGPVKAPSAREMMVSSVGPITSPMFDSLLREYTRLHKHHVQAEIELEALREIVDEYLENCSCYPIASLPKRTEPYKPA